MDPNERNTPDWMDFKYFSLSCSGPYLVDIIMGFYSAPVFDGDYFIYVSVDDDHLPEYNIRVHEELFSVAHEIKPGWFADYKYSGTPEVENDSHRISIPWDFAIESSNDYLIYCYNMEGKDRIPNEGSLLFDKDSCTISYISKSDLERLYHGLEEHLKEHEIE